MAEHRPWWPLVTTAATDTLRPVREIVQPVFKWLRDRVEPPDIPKDGPKKPGDDVH
jgi:hypothetical protein